MDNAKNLHVLILAAGQGKRMKSVHAKVVHPLLHRPMIHYVIEAAMSLKAASISVVVGHGEQGVRTACESFPHLHFFRQQQQLGTADAVRATLEFLSKQHGHCLVLSGDVPLITSETLRSLFDSHLSKSAAVTLVTGKVEAPKGYGRIVRDPQGNFTRICEQADCTPSEEAINEINAGIYCFQLSSLVKHIARVTNNNHQKEYYLTDVLGLAKVAGESVETFSLPDNREMAGINDRSQLAEAERYLRHRINTGWMNFGVTMSAPETITIDSRTELSGDVTLESGVCLVGSKVGAGSYIEANSRIIDCKLGNSVRVKQGSYLASSVLSDEVSVGPYAHLRPGSELGVGVKIGNFVELKNAKFAKGAKASHLSYIGDATIGENVNLGCGFITCNYDGAKKHQTVIESGVFIGSDSQTVAPVTIGKNSYIASGTTVTENVPEDSLVVSRGRQITKPGYAKKYRKADPA